MTTEPNLRVHERTHTGVPYGYGAAPVASKIRAPGPTLNAVSRPQQILIEDRAPGGPDSGKSDARKALELLDWWDRFKATFEEIPGLWRSLLGILATPIRWLKWLFGPHERWAIAAIVVVVVFVLGLAAIPLVTSCGGRDARRAEGEQLMGCVRDYCRVEYSKTGDVDAVARRLEVKVREGAFKGKYFDIEPRIVVVKPGIVRIYAYSNHPENGFGTAEFEWQTGSTAMRWDRPGGRR